jgi:hypothetical protein
VIFNGLRAHLQAVGMLFVLGLDMLGKDVQAERLKSVTRVQRGGPTPPCRDAVGRRIAKLVRS